MTQVPYDQEAEECVLGAMLLSDQAIDQVSHSLTARDFYKPSHAHIYDAILALRKEGTKADPVTVAETMKRNGTLDSIGDNGSYLISLQVNVPSIGSAGHYAKIVLDRSLRRSIVMESVEMAEKARDLTLDAETTLEVYRAILATLGDATLQEGPDDIAVEDFVEAHRESDPLAKWVVYGLLRKQHKLMIVGPESGGKSVLMRYIAICAAYGITPFRHRKVKPIRTLLVDLENPSDALCESFEMILKRVWQESDEPDPVARLWWRPAGIDLRSRADVAQFENVIRTRKPELVCLGPMYQAFETKSSEHWETPARQVMATLKQLMVRYDFALILEDHAPQADSSGKRPMRPYGSSFWRRWLDIGIGMEAEGDDLTYFRMNQWKRRVGTDWPSHIRRGEKGGWPWLAEWNGDR